MYRHKAVNPYTSTELARVKRKRKYVATFCKKKQQGFLIDLIKGWFESKISSTFFLWGIRRLPVLFAERDSLKDKLVWKPSSVFVCLFVCTQHVFIGMVSHSY